MPHIVLEHSANRLESPDLDALFGQLQARAVAIGGFNPALFKCRRIANDFSRCGDGDPNNAFVALQIAILSGRDQETISALGVGLIEVLRQHYARSIAERRCDISVEVREIPRSHYYKGS